MKLSIVIPAYNEVDNIVTTVEEIIVKIEQAITQKLIASFEIIVVDDHSDDGTFESVMSLQNKRIKCIRLSRRSGSHIALRAGLQHCCGEVAIYMDSDGQDDPAVICDMLEKWRKKTYIVWALRYDRNNEQPMNKIFSVMFYKILGWLSQHPPQIDLARADFYLLDRKIIDIINSCRERNTSLMGLVTWMGFRQGYVEYERRERKSGKSKWNFSAKIHLAKDWIIAFSPSPIVWITRIGAMMLGCGLLFAIYFLTNNIFYKSTLNSSILIIVALLIIGGMQMVMSGILGEYLYRNLEEARDRPLFIVEEIFEVHE